MASLQISVNEDQVSLSGDLNYTTVVSALNENVFGVNASASQAISVDFSEVVNVDSSALALMVHWLREAKKRNLIVEFNHTPPKLIALAEMSNLDEVLPIS